MRSAFLAALCPSLIVGRLNAVTGVYGTNLAPEDLSSIVSCSSIALHGDIYSTVSGKHITWPCWRRRIPGQSGDPSKFILPAGLICVISSLSLQPLLRGERYSTGPLPHVLNMYTIPNISGLLCTFSLYEQCQNNWGIFGHQPTEPQAHRILKTPQTARDHKRQRVVKDLILQCSSTMQV